VKVRIANCDALDVLEKSLKSSRGRFPEAEELLTIYWQHHLSQVYSFVPIPGAQQHKRPRRRYEEIERMYKCGWHGCEKAYGTLNHLNAHVTMQSHGQKRTPEGTLNFGLEWGFCLCAEAIFFSTPTSSAFPISASTSWKAFVGFRGWSFLIVRVLL
jgi:regulator of replication initiation timing